MTPTEVAKKCEDPAEKAKYMEALQTFEDELNAGEPLKRRRKKMDSARTQHILCK